MARFFSCSFACSLLLIPGAGLALGACGGSTTSGPDAGTIAEHDAASGRSDAASPPQAVVSSTLGAASTGSCNRDEPSSTPFLTIGTQGDPVTSGTGSASVACQVHAVSAGSYTVNAQITVGSLGGLTVSGTLSDTTGPQPGFVAEFTTGENSYEEASCTFTLTTEVAMPVASGRVWGTLSCPMLAEPTDSAICAGTAQIILQNCSE